MKWANSCLFATVILCTPVQAGYSVCMSLCSLAVGLGFVAATPTALAAAGFTSGGVAAGSMAASWMSAYGGAVASGSIFATLQSAGAAGVSWATSFLTGSSAMAPCAAVCSLV